MNDDGQEALFDYPVPSRPAPRMATRPGKATYARYRPAIRRLCDDCIRDIHVRGIAVAPHPCGVHWRRASAATVEYLCVRHKDERMAADACDD